MTTKKTTQRQGFKTSEFIVYPAHGVGRSSRSRSRKLRAPARAVRHQLRQGQDDAAGSHRQDRVGRHAQARRAAVGQARARDAQGPRPRQAYDVVAPRPGIRGQINSGDIVAIAEVVRDLFRSDTQPEQSYSERQLYEAALDRLSREISAVQRITETEAIKRSRPRSPRARAAVPSPPKAMATKSRWSRKGGVSARASPGDDIRGPGGNAGPFARCYLRCPSD